jgi:hypothetical protein
MNGPVSEWRHPSSVKHRHLPFLPLIPHHNKTRLLVKQMEINSSVTFHEAKVALARQWIGQNPEAPENQMTLTLLNPMTEGVIVSDKMLWKTDSEYPRV